MSKTSRLLFMRSDQRLLVCSFLVSIFIVLFKNTIFYYLVGRTTSPSVLDM